MAKLRAGYKQHADGKLEYRFTFEGTRYSVYGFTYKECEEKKEAKLTDIKAGLYTRNRNITLSAYYDEWQKGREGVITKSTRYTNDRRFGRIKEVMGREKVRNIETRQIRALQRELSKTLKTTTVNDIIILLGSILESAVNDKIITSNPCKSVKSLKRLEAPAAETYHRALNEEEQELFFKYAVNTWYYELFAFMISTGCRVSEAAALTWRDIDYTNNVIHITKTLSRVSNTEWIVSEPKTKTSRRDIPLTDAVKKILIKQREKGGNVLDVNGTIFSAAHGGYALRGQVNAAINNIRKNIAKTEGQEIEKFTSHAFRDTFATRAIEQGMKPNTLKTILGHSSIRITMDIYAHVMPNTKQEEMELISIVV